MTGGIDWDAMENVHPREQCDGQPCVIHNPTDHHMRSWPAQWRHGKAMVERTCEHGVGHPDPDQKHAPNVTGIHGCDGCCVPPRGDPYDPTPIRVEGIEVEGDRIRLTVADGEDVTRLLYHRWELVPDFYP